MWSSTFDRESIPTLAPMNPKYQIFISSTYEDLKEERDQLIKATLEIGHIPVGMEMFNAADEEQWETIKRTIDQCDYYAVIVAHRYGSIDEATGLSFTEKEYDYAVSIGVPVIAFVLDSAAEWRGDRREDDPEKLAKLGAFKKKVKGKPVNFWTNKDNLNARFSAAFPKLIVSRPRPGWVRATEAASPEMAGELTRLSRENAELRDRLANSQNLVLLPEFELSLLIFWTTYHVYSSKADERGVPLSEKVEGYRLLVELKNVGNTISERAKVVLNIPWRMQKEEKDITTKDRIDLWRRIEICLQEDVADFPSRSTTRKSIPLLPGESKTTYVNLVEGYASCIEPVRYTIHPDHGFAREGQIKASDIQVCSSKPEPEE